MNMKSKASDGMKSANENEERLGLTNGNIKKKKKGILKGLLFSGKSKSKKNQSGENSCSKSDSFSSLPPQVSGTHSSLELTSSSNSALSDKENSTKPLIFNNHNHAILTASPKHVHVSTNTKGTSHRSRSSNGIGSPQKRKSNTDFGRLSISFSDHNNSDDDSPRSIPTSPTSFSSPQSSQDDIILTKIPIQSEFQKTDGVGLFKCPQSSWNDPLKFNKTNRTAPTTIVIANCIADYSSCHNNKNTTDTISHKEKLIHDLTLHNNINITDENNNIYVERMLLTRSALSRPFGRTTLPSHLAKRWSVQVSNPEFDHKDNCHYYNVHVQQDDSISVSNSLDTYTDGIRKQTSSKRNEESPLSTSFVMSNVKRSLVDFLWLEEALNEEYHGSLFLPLLSMSLNNIVTDDPLSLDVADVENNDDIIINYNEPDPVTQSIQKLNTLIRSNKTVDPKHLSDWLSDVLNLVRGKGEMILNFSNNHQVHDFDATHILNSESMEAFLYRNTNKLPLPKQYYSFLNSTRHYPSWLSMTIFQNLPTTTSTLIKQKSSFTTTSSFLSPTREKHIHASSSSALITTLFSNAIRKCTVPNHISHINDDNKLLPQSIAVQRYYLSLQRDTTLRVMYRLRALIQEETSVNAAWKRFAISLSNLYSFEKDIESAKIGDSNHQPIQNTAKPKKLSKHAVDDHLRIFARQKMDRFIPSLKVLFTMLSAYLVDLSSVDPSIHAFLSHRKSSIFRIPPCASDTALCAASPEKIGVNMMEKHQPDNRPYLHRNETLLERGLLQFCNSKDIRLSRMAWKLFKVEASQASLLCASATKMKSKFQGMESEVTLLDDSEIDDDEKELEIVKCIVALGKPSYKYRPISPSASERSVRSDGSAGTLGTGCDAENDKSDSSSSSSIKRALLLANERVGRWNSETAEAILEAAGVPDIEILMEETSSELRVVRKLVLGLQENISRCSEAIQMLEDIVLGEKGDEEEDENKSSATGKNNKTQLGGIKMLRNRFSHEFATLLSSTYPITNSNLSKDVIEEHKKSLTNLGIIVNDPCGWLRDDKFSGHCGRFVKQYQEARDKDISQLISQMKELLNQHERRSQELYNFILLQTVGIQIEKHFSKLRAEELAAWEKKTDITTAINLATRKNLPHLIHELNLKLEHMNIKNVSHTSVKEAKERHFGSKSLKMELESLARRRFQRLQNTSTDVTSMIQLWAKHEETNSNIESELLEKVVKEIETSVLNHYAPNKIQEDGGAHLFALYGSI